MAAIGLGAGLALLAERWWQAGVVARIGRPFHVDLRPELIVGALALALVVGFLASLYPAWRAARVDPVDVIRGT